MEPTFEDLGRRSRKRLQMLEHLANTAGRLFEAQGYEPVTMEQIAAEADVAKRTLYNHFATKEAVLAYWIDAELARDLAHLQRDVARRKTFVSRVSCLLNASADWCEKHPVYLMAYLRHRFLSIGVDESDNVRASGSDIAVTWQQLIAAGQQAGELSKGFQADQLAAWFHHLYLAALLRWLNMPSLSLREEFRAVIKLFVEGAGGKTKSK